MFTHFFNPVVQILGTIIVAAEADAEYTAAFTPVYKKTKYYKVDFFDLENGDSTGVPSTVLPVSIDAGIIYESTGYGYQEVEFSEKVSGDDILSFDGKKVFITGVGEEQFNPYIPFGDDKYSWVTFKAVVYALFDYTATGYSGTYDEQYHTIGGVDVLFPESGATVKYGTVEGTYDLDAPPSYKDPGTYPVYY